MRLATIRGRKLSKLPGMTRSIILSSDTNNNRSRKGTRTVSGPVRVNSLPDPIASGLSPLDAQSSSAAVNGRQRRTFHYMSYTADIARHGRDHCSCRSTHRVQLESYDGGGFEVMVLLRSRSALYRTSAATLITLFAIKVSIALSE